MKKTHLLLMLALCATLLASCSAGEPDVTQTQPVPSISPTIRRMKHGAARSGR